uniref:V-type proton ATPase subunit a n=1 Tax=Clastoptera arizonana TaxID=38151 RepID=A0A1B6D6J7_9HEMI
MLWRISRGNVFLRQAELEQPLEDPNTGNEIFKTVFVAFFQGEQLKSRVKKVCAGFHASFYPCPSSYEERQDMVKGVKARLEDLTLVLNQTKDHRQRVLVTVAKELHNWTVMVRKMKAIYHTLNMFNMDVTKKCLIGECWVPVKDLGTVRKSLTEGGNAVGSSIPSFLNVIECAENPPTFIRTNRFTHGFQALIDAYGIASYREVNPALYTIITFPFLFAVMFGDCGHGFILLLFAAYMILNEKKIQATKSDNEIWNIFFAGRYIILLMGLFSIYTGLIYNDLFSKMMNIFGTSWNVTYDGPTLMDNKDLTLDPATDYIQVPYPLGMDPIWQSATNKIVFLNSFKMKLSIIFGVVHMMFGITLGVINHIHFGHPVYIILEFLPQIIFLCLLFLYLVVLMFMKWVIYSPANPLTTSPRCAPSVLILFINMILFKKTETYDGCEPNIYPNQESIQLGFVLVALVCVPWMLFGKPIYLVYFSDRKKKSHVASNGDLTQGIELQGSNNVAEESGHDHEDESTGDIFIHQGIHTIEYVLSTISHTASYLRLWALSLAHAQLSEVLWTMVLSKGLTIFNTWIGGILLFVTFMFWAVFTIAILVMMEGLSAFLHTLRLHWVEFMSKFFTGTGYLFHPFSFKHVLEASEESSDD